MTNATLPTTQNVSLLGGLVKIYVDQYNSIKNLYFPLTASANGTKFIPLLDARTGANYTVPAATNCQMWGFEQWLYQFGGANPTVIQFGYADDGSGTNFTLLFDLRSAYGTATVTKNNQISQLMTVPTGKIPQVKIVDSATTENASINVVGLETN